MFQWLWFRHSS